MPAMDHLTLKLMSDPIVFADAFNLLLYNGKQIIRPHHLKNNEKLLQQLKENVPLDEPTLITQPIADIVPDDPNLVFNTQNNKSQFSIKRMRDILKQCVWMTDNQTHYFILGIENQTDIHYLMPIRTMLYDALGYDRQISEIQAKLRKTGSVSSLIHGAPKNTKLHGIITLVCYFGLKRWDGPRNLHELLDIKDKRLLKFIPNYFINLLEPYGLSPRKIAKLQSELGALYACYQAYDKQELETFIQTDKRLKTLSLTTTNIINHRFNLEINTEELAMSNNNDVCQVMQRYYKKLYNDGYAKAQEDMKAEFHLTLIDAKREVDDAKREADDAKREADDAKREVDDAKREALQSKHLAAQRLIQRNIMTYQEIADVLSLPVDVVESLAKNKHA